ncbi:hypothetical protein B0A50_06599 [Salinomyces thailandicus]|uniref:F-box domain-containing protein n=1 Tax=Salinomyces thailandicus TaxID=706561 RepID=A0A4U0TRU4_9PEZI|nr:hypothetical protein B0A50_06599 [Salinomyces thailandica]
MADNKLVFLPNEIWLNIAAYCDPKDLWLSLRLINRQLQACVEQHFIDDILPQSAITLPIALPSYDVRNPLHGKAILRYQERKKGDGGEEGGHQPLYSLLRVEPAHYRAQLLDRWERMREVAGGQVGDKLHWNLRLRHASVRMPLKDARIEGDQSLEAGSGRLSFDWRPTFSRFFQSIYPGQVYWSW